jgi:hypothetical protein
MSLDDPQSDQLRATRGTLDPYKARTRRAFAGSDASCLPCSALIFSLV